MLPVRWGASGGLLAGVRSGASRRVGLQPREIVRISPKGAVEKLSAPINVPCDEFDLSPDGRLAACTALLTRPDVWLADTPGRSGW